MVEICQNVIRHTSRIVIHTAQPRTSPSRTVSAIFKRELPYTDPPWRTEYGYQMRDIRLVP